MWPHVKQAFGGVNGDIYKNILPKFTYTIKLLAVIYFEHIFDKDNIF